MKHLITLLLSFVAATSLFGGLTTDVYRFQMKVRVPRIYDNTTSKGSRQWQTQYIIGEMHVDYSVDDIAPTVTFKNCYNRTHKINGRWVTYLCDKDAAQDITRRWVVMGSNKTGRFVDGSCFFYADFEPSYNLGEDEPDNSLLLYFGGMGSLKRVVTSRTWNCRQYGYKVVSWKGYCVGTMGCGCRAYGHVSPTRVLGLYGPVCDYVTDVAAIPMGQWKALYSHSY